MSTVKMPSSTETSGLLVQTPKNSYILYLNSRSSFTPDFQKARGEVDRHGDWTVKKKDVSTLVSMS